MPALPFRKTLAAGLLAFAPLVLTLALPGTISAQTIVTVSPQQCVWRAGDDLAWAAPTLDETGWKPYSNWVPSTAEPRIWVRCHPNLSSLRQVDQPALQVTLYAAYQLFADGRSLGSAGNLESGAFTMDTDRDWPFSGGSTQTTVIALRVTRLIVSMVPIGALPPLEIRAGNRAALRDRRNSEMIAQVRQHLIPALCFNVIGVIGFVVLGLYLNDRLRPELMLLGVQSIALPLIYLNYLGVAAFLSYPVAANFASWAIPGAITNVARTIFFFALARRRVPLLFWALIVLATFQYAVTLAVPLLPPAQAIWLDTFRSSRITAISDLAAVLESFAPVVAFLPWRDLSNRMKPLAALSMIWGATMAIFFTVRLTGVRIAGIPDLAGRWSVPVSDVEALVTLSVIVALLALLFRDQRRVADERAVMAGEMASAREIQQYLIPEKLPPTPGLAIQNVYLPSREVGGDFFQVLPDARDGSTLIVVGDVAGKGLQAGMLSALIVGAIRTAFHFTGEPGEILALLNERLQGRGLVTCQAMRIQPSGAVELANAGHLLPYRNGKELAVEGSLPLGAVPGIEFQIMRFQLAEGETMLLVSDGVVEARNAAGELFGFERTAAIATESVQNIAAAAQRFGQEDDITVLTLKRFSAS
ncbi:MAG TPA: PP2C family protein-serine/threonine phosphatase [Terracidiphilus sp.]|jgi:hypothetical protein